MEKCGLERCELFHGAIPLSLKLPFYLRQRSDACRQLGKALAPTRDNTSVKKKQSGEPYKSIGFLTVDVDLREKQIIQRDVHQAGQQ